MSLIPVSTLKPGMVLSKDAQAPNGIVLLGKGASLNDRSIDILKSWGVSEVEIERPESNENQPDPSTALSEEERARIRRQVEERFRHNDLDDPVVAELLKVSLHREWLRAAKTS